MNNSAGSVKNDEYIRTAEALKNRNECEKCR